MNTMTISSGIPRPIKAPFTGGYIADSTTFVLAALLAAGFALQPAYAQFASGVSVVEVYASVVDLRGEPVTNLDQSDFIVTENGAQQQIAVFTPGNFPLSVAIGVDRSFSMAGANLAAAKSGARLFLAELRPEDEASVLAIGSQVETVAPLSRDRAAQLNAVDKLDAFGTTGLYDSVSKAIQIMQTAKGRRALVLLSDGNDRYSRSTPDAALALARKSDVMVYPIALGSQTSPFFLQIYQPSGNVCIGSQRPLEFSISTTSLVAISGTSISTRPASTRIAGTQPETSSRAEALPVPPGNATETVCLPIGMISRIGPFIIIGLVRLTRCTASLPSPSRVAMSSTPGWAFIF